MFLYIVIGWGIVTHQNLAKASFICEYTGKLILAKNIENYLSSYIYEFRFNNKNMWYVLLKL